MGGFSQSRHIAERYGVLREGEGEAAGRRLTSPPLGASQRQRTDTPLDTSTSAAASTNYYGSDNKATVATHGNADTATTTPLQQNQKG